LIKQEPARARIHRPSHAKRGRGPSPPWPSHEIPECIPERIRQRVRRLRPRSMMLPVALRLSCRRPWPQSMELPPASVDGAAFGSDSAVAVGLSRGPSRASPRPSHANPERIQNPSPLLAQTQPPSPLASVEGLEVHVPLGLPGRPRACRSRCAWRDRTAAVRDSLLATRRGGVYARPKAYAAVRDGSATPACAGVWRRRWRVHLGGI
jgi:hypothetical protein